MKKGTVIAIIGIAAVIALIVGAIRLVSGLVSGAVNLVLGVIVVAALIVIVIWMFAYAKSQQKK